MKSVIQLTPEINCSDICRITKNTIDKFISNNGDKDLVLSIEVRKIIPTTETAKKLEYHGNPQ
jgi:hypothetical protein